MGIAGLVLQLVGTAIAAAALILEFLDDRTLTPGQVGRLPRRHENPWEARLRGRSFTAILRHEQARARAHTRHQPQAPSPEVFALTEYLFTWLNERETLLSKDWQRQLELDTTMRAELARIVEEQMRLLREDRIGTRNRIRAEMVGLLLVAVGTVLSSL